MTDPLRALLTERFTRHMRGDELDPPKPPRGETPTDPHEAIRYVRYDDEMTTRLRCRELLAAVDGAERGAA